MNSKRERVAMKALAGFMIVMLLLTFLSRLADSITIPKVSVMNPQGGRIDQTIELMGTLQANNELDIEAQEGFRIKDVLVKSGDEVEVGTPLVQLDLEQIQDKIEALQVDIQKLHLQKKQITLDSVGTNSDDPVAQAMQVMNRLEEDKVLTSTQEDVKIARLEDELRQVEEERLQAQKSYEDFTGKNLADQITKVKETVEEAKKNLEKQKYEQEKALKRAQQAVDEARNALSMLGGGDATAAIERLERAQMEYDMTESDWKRNVKDAEEVYSKAQDKLAKLEAGEIDDTLLESEKEKVKRAEEAVKLKKNAIEDAKYNKEQALAKYDRDLVDAQRKIEQAQQETVKKQENQEKENEKSDIRLELMQLDIDVKEKELDQLLALKAIKGMIKSPVKGRIDTVSAKKGDQTTSTSLMTLVSEETQYTFEAEIDAKRAEKLAVGDVVSITLAGEKLPVEGQTVIGHITNMPGEDEKKKITVDLEQGSPGASGKMVIRKESDKYPSLVPLEALREDYQGKYVLVVREQVTTLGKELVVERVGVTPLEQNSKNVGVQGGLQPSDQVVVDANKPIGAGDRVRLISK
ncbi:MAG: HlyD family efflux transporter periplasmic adaptor subunit [Cellulosilyticaceae bacterium]